jgi:hypothetical protein
MPTTPTHRNVVSQMPASASKQHPGRSVQRHPVAYLDLGIEEPDVTQARNIITRTALLRDWVYELSFGIRPYVEASELYGFLARMALADPQSRNIHVVKPLMSAIFAMKSVNHNDAFLRVDMPARNNVFSTLAPAHPEIVIIPIFLNSRLQTREDWANVLTNERLIGHWVGEFKTNGSLKFCPLDVRRLVSNARRK